MSTTSNVISAHHVQLTRRPSANGALTKHHHSGASSAEATKPQMSLVKDGNRVRAVVITCSCGEVIQLECEYES